MSTLESRVQASHRRGSAVKITSNPLDDATAATTNQLKSLSLADAVQIPTADLTTLVAGLKTCSDNQQLLDKLEEEKLPFLFNSSDLVEILDITVSVKTRLSIVLALAPRITDPRTGLDKVTTLFRYADEKSQIEEAFKSRMQVINASVFSRANSLAGSTASGRGTGRGGRGILSPGRSVFIKSYIADDSSPDKPRPVSMPVISRAGSEEPPSPGPLSQESKKPFAVSSASGAAATKEIV